MAHSDTTKLTPPETTVPAPRDSGTSDFAGPKPSDTNWPGLPPCRPGPAIVLVAPCGPLNIGSVARVMRNFGLGDLRLVRPGTDPLHDDAKRMAMRAIGTLERAKEQTYPTLGAALHDAHTVVATSARSRGGPNGGPACLSPEELFESALPALLPGTPPVLGPGTAFVFGNEESGLSLDDLLHAQAVLSLPTDPAFASLNLAQAVALVCYEMKRNMSLWPQAATLATHKTQRAKAEAPLAAGQLLEELESQTSQWLSANGFLQPLTLRARMRQLAHIIRRCRLSNREAHLLLAIVRFARSRASGHGQPHPRGGHAGCNDPGKTTVH